MDRKVRAASLSILSNSVLVALKLIVGVMTGSVSIISEAAHSALDLVAALIAFFSVRVSGRPADKEHPFGHGKIENLAGTIEAVLIFVAAVWIIREAMHKLLNLKHHQVETVALGIAVMGVSTLLNIFVARYLFRVAKATDSIALEADAHHLSTDVYTSMGVFIGLTVIQFTGWQVMDPIVALIVAVMIIRVALSLTRKAALPLLDVQLPDSELNTIKQIITQTPGVLDYHKLRTRKSGPYRQVDLHILVPPDMHVDEAHNIAESIEEKMRDAFPDIHVITHIEPDMGHAEVIQEHPQAGR